MNEKTSWETAILSQFGDNETPRAYLSAILQCVPVFICVVNAKQDVVFISQHYASIYSAYSPDAKDAVFPLEEASLYPNELYSQLETLNIQAASNQAWTELRVKYLDGSLHPYRFSKIMIESDGGPAVMTIGLAASDQNQIDASLREYKSTAQHLAFNDALTGLANRALFYDRLNKVLSSAKRDGRHFALMLIDLDQFSLLNDQHGRDVGDRYLKFIAEKICEVVRDVDTVARIGGDKFIVILDNIVKGDHLEQVANKLLQAASATLILESGAEAGAGAATKAGGVTKAGAATKTGASSGGGAEEVACTASMGVSLFPKDGDSTEQLLRHADVAIGEAKVAGKNQHQFFAKAMTQSAVNYLLLENDLQNAIEREELELAFQPQVNIRSGEICGLEVLVRWNHPTRGFLRPGQFIPLAEESGLIEPLGEWVLRRSIAIFKTWLDSAYDFGKLSVNVSARQFRNPGFNDLIADVLKDSGLSVNRLELELTESATMENAAQAIENLNRLRQSGVSIALDDFGTGYSSLSYLQRFPIQKLKIDKSFIDDVENSLDAAATTKSIIDLAHNMGLDVIAEGVEREGQVHWLDERGCVYIQGDFFSKPLSEDALMALVKNSSRVRLDDGHVFLLL